MTQNQFLQNFLCKVDIQNHGGVNLVIITDAISRSTGHVVDSVRSSHNIQITSQAIADSQTLISLMPFDWARVVDFTKRAHLEYFVQRFQITDYYPNDSKLNPDISIMYQ